MSPDQESPRDETEVLERSAENIRSRADTMRQGQTDADSRPGKKAKGETQAGQQRVDPGEETALQKGYEKHLEKAAAEQGRQVERQLKALEKLAKKYEKQARKGIDQAKLDVEAMRADFQGASAEDPDSALKRFEEARAKWAPRVSKAVTATGVDARQGSEEAKALLAADTSQDLQSTRSRVTERALESETLIGYSINIDTWWTPPPPPPPPPPATSTVVIPKPYTLGSIKGRATADRNSGRLSSYNSPLAGSQQELASVGGPFVADASVRRIRVETVVDARYYTNVGAIWGYASAEVIINLKVLDGATLRGSQRLSLVRTISAVLWVSSDSGSGAYTLACEFNHAYGTPKTYAALVELETWAGGGGLLVVSPATASGTATPRDITVTLMR